MFSYLRRFDTVGELQDQRYWKLLKWLDLEFANSIRPTEGSL
jgi:hypothetical protein